MSIVAPVSAGATNRDVGYISDTGGIFVKREGEMSVALDGGASQNVVIQGTSGGVITFWPALTDAASATITLRGASQNMAFRTLSVLGSGYMGIYWRTADSGSLFENIYVSGKGSARPTDGNKMVSGIGWLTTGASQMTLDGMKNIEWMGCSQAAFYVGNFVTSVDNLHIEGIRLIDDNATMVRAVANAALNIQGLEFRLETVSGEIVAALTLADGANLDAESVSGDVKLTFGQPVNGEFDVESFSGDIDNCFGPKPARADKFTPGTELHFTQGTGQARVSLETLSGDIVFCNK